MREIGKPHTEYFKNPSQKETWSRPLDFVEDGFNPNASFREFLQTAVENPEQFIGKGGAGKVFDLGNGWCIKLTENRHMLPDKDKYDLGNTMQVEARIQNKISEYEVRGVRAPRVLCYQIGSETCAMIMETLIAVNLQEVLNGKQEMPKTFNADIFGEVLDDYIQGLHNEYGIVHYDLEPRNVMVSTETGLPYVIDFGRSKIYRDIESAEAINAFDKDTDALDRIYDKLQSFSQKA